MFNKSVLIILFLLLSCFLFSLKLPSWVVEIPELNSINFAVGVSNKFEDEEKAIVNAFDAACYELACQRKSLVQAKTLDVSGTEGFIFFETVIPDRSDVEYFKESAKILDKYSDKKYTYILVATDSIEVNTDIVHIDEDNHPLVVSSENNNEYFGIGSSNYISSVGFIYAANRAKANVCEQLHIRINLFSITGEKDINIMQKETEVIIRDLKIIGYHVNYSKNIITAIAKYKIN